MAIGSGSDLILIVICFLFPPAAVLMMTGCSFDLFINVCLTILGVIPGHIHGFWLIYRKMQAQERHGFENLHYHGNGEWIPQAGFAAPPTAGYGTLQ